MENKSTKVTEKDRAEAVADELGVKYSPDGKRLLGADFWDLRKMNVTSYTVKPGTQVICDGAFIECDFLEEISLPDSVTSIGDGAFRECSSLTSIAIPDSVTHIGDAAFGGCASLTSIVIPDGVTSIA